MTTRGGHGASVEVASAWPLPRLLLRLLLSLLLRLLRLLLRRRVAMAVTCPDRRLTFHRFVFAPHARILGEVADLLPTARNAAARLDVVRRRPITFGGDAVGDIDLTGDAVRFGD